MAVQTFVVELADSRFSGRAIRKYPIPYLGLIFRLIITACLCYSVQLITKNEVPQYLYAVQVALCVYFVLENIYVYVHMLLFRIPQNDKEFKNQRWCTIAFYIVKAFIIIASAVTFWQMVVKFASIRSYVTVTVVCLVADNIMILMRYAHYSKELNVRRWYLNLHEDRNQLAGVEFTMPDSEKLKESLIGKQISNRVSIVFVFGIIMFSVYEPGANYHICARIIFTSLAILDTTFFLYSVETDKRMNERELSKHEGKMNNLLLNKWYVMFIPILYFDLVMNLSMATGAGPLISIMGLYFLMDNRLMRLQIVDYKRRLGIPNL